MRTLTTFFPTGTRVRVNMQDVTGTVVGHGQSVEVLVRAKQVAAPVVLVELDERFRGYLDNALNDRMFMRIVAVHPDNLEEVA